MLDRSNVGPCKQAVVGAAAGAVVEGPLVPLAEDLSEVAPSSEGTELSEGT